jgi:hypothetical protein
MQSPILIDLSSRKPLPPLEKRCKFMRWFALAIICAAILIIVALEMRWIPIGMKNSAISAKKNAK